MGKRREKKDPDFLAETPVKDSKLKSVGAKEVKSVLKSDKKNKSSKKSDKKSVTFEDVMNMPDVPGFEKRRKPKLRPRQRRNPRMPEYEQRRQNRDRMTYQRFDRGPGAGYAPHPSEPRGLGRRRGGHPV